MADIAITQANVVAGARAKKAYGIAGETILAGESVYFDSATRRYFKADSNGTAAQAAVEGIALNEANAGQDITVVWEDDDFTPGYAIVAGDIVIQSATAGRLAPAADLAVGMRNTVIMVGKAANKAVLRLVKSPDAKP